MVYVNSDTETAGTKHTAALADGFEYQHSSTAVLRHKVLHSNAMYELLFVLALVVLAPDTYSYK